MACKISGKRNLHWCFTSTPYLGFGLLIHFFLVVFGPENETLLVVGGKFLFAIVFEKAKRATEVERLLLRISFHLVGKCHVFHELRNKKR